MFGPSNGDVTDTLERLSISERPDSDGPVTSPTGSGGSSGGMKVLKKSRTVEDLPERNGGLDHPGGSRDDPGATGMKGMEGKREDSGAAGGMGKERFVFASFLEIWRKPEALPLTLLVKKFIKEYSTKPVPIDKLANDVQDFLLFMEDQVLENPLWANATDAEIDRAMEGIEKTLMNKIYDFAYPSQEDYSHDEMITKKIQRYRWLKPHHIDIPVSPLHESHFQSAQQELIKINKYKAPRDKIVCILNCCKVLSSLMKKCGVKGADEFLPLLIFVVIKANPSQIYLNSQYIQRFRKASKLQEETMYYFTHLQGALAFVENMDDTNLNISKEELDRNIEQTLKELAEEEQAAIAATQDSPSTSPPLTGQPFAFPLPAALQVTKKKHAKKPSSSSSNFGEMRPRTVSTEEIYEVPGRKHSFSQVSVASVSSSQLYDVEERFFGSQEEIDPDRREQKATQVSVSNVR